MNLPHLGKEAIDRFASDGFLHLRQFMNDHEFSELLHHVQRFLHQVVPTLPAEQVFYGDKNNRETLKQIQHMENHDDWFHQTFNHGPFREVAEILLGDDVVPKNLQFFNKPPGGSDPTPPHQDGYYFMLDPCHAVTMWFALDHVDEQNGCVRYGCGSHKRGMRDHLRTNVLGFSQGIDGYPTQVDLDHEVAAPASPGDLLVHHALTIHRADGNHSPDRQRRALGFIYYAAQAIENIEEHQAYQRRLAADMRHAGKI